MLETQTDIKREDLKMFKKLCKKRAEIKANEAELAHLRRFTNALAWVADRGNVRIQINLNNTVIISVSNVVDGQLVRLCEIPSTNMERALYETVAVLYGQQQNGAK